MIMPMKNEDDRRSKAISTRVTPELYDELRKLSDRMSWSMGMTIYKTLEAGLRDSSRKIIEGLYKSLNELEMKEVPEIQLAGKRKPK